MELIVQSDASYNSRKQARSVAGFLMYFGDAKNALQPDGKPTLKNGAIMSGSVVMNVIVASAGEAEYGAGFTAAQHAVNARIIAEELGHPQPATPILCDTQPRHGLMQTTSIKSYRHAFPLASRSHATKPVRHGISSRQRHLSRHIHQNIVS